MNQQPPPPLPVADVEPPKAPVAIARVSRELKVEDALLYLDQVKMEFSEKPYIYNEFLDIMKNFKAQSIGTPGVIERVKNLFKGYNKLILGFNTFLPEGEGYKIELTPEELAGDAKKVAPVVKTETSSYSSSFVAPTRQQIDSTFTNHAARMNQPGQTTNTEPLAGQPQQMQQAHAIHYVTKIRNRFSDQPDTYRQFLKILHTYQKEQKGIKEVLEQVSTLFADHSDLLMEFTYFLPDAVQEQAKERLHRAARESEARRHAKMAATRAAAGTKKVNPPGVVTSQPMTIGNVFRPQNPLSFGESRLCMEIQFSNC
jgi:paired amphipathic helix protein Sin3a